MGKIEMQKEYGALAVIKGFKAGRPVAIGLEDGTRYVLSVRNDFKPGDYVEIKDTSVRRLPEEVVDRLTNKGNGNGVSKAEIRFAAVPSGSRDEAADRGTAYRKRLAVLSYSLI